MSLPTDLSPTDPAPAYRAPLLWLLGGMIAGYTLAPTSLQPSESLLIVAGLCCALMALGASWKRPASWSLLFLSGSTLLAWAYALERSTPLPPGWQDLPPREAELTLEVVHTHNARENRASGVARIIAAPDSMPELLEQPVSYYLYSEEQRSSLVPTESFTARGVIAVLDENAADLSGFHRYLLSKDVHFELSKGQVGERSPPTWYQQLFLSLRQKSIQAFLGQEAAPSDDRLGVLPAFVLGQRYYLTNEQSDLFKATGTLHLFAISGLHVGIVGAMLFWLLRWLPLTRRQSAVIGLLLLLLYVGVTGLSISAQRAYFMVLFFWGSYAFQRQSNPLAALAAAAVFILLLRPNELWQAGFQLSFGVVAAILLYARPLNLWLENRFALYRGLPPTSYTHWHRFNIWFRKYALGLFAVSLAATLLSNLLTAHHFASIAPIGLLLNLVLVPLAFALMLVGLLTLITGILSIPLLPALGMQVGLIFVWLMTGLPALTNHYGLAGITLTLQPHALGLWLTLLQLTVMALAPYQRRPLLAFALPPAFLLGSLLLFGTFDTTPL